MTQIAFPSAYFTNPSEAIEFAARYQVDIEHNRQKYLEAVKFRDSPEGQKHIEYHGHHLYPRRWTAEELRRMRLYLEGKDILETAQNIKDDPLRSFQEEVEAYDAILRKVRACESLS